MRSRPATTGLLRSCSRISWKRQTILARRLVTEAANFCDEQDKNQERNNKQPEGAFDGHQDARCDDSAHNQPHQHCQEKFHLAAMIPKPGGFSRATNVTVCDRIV